METKLWIVALAIAMAITWIWLWVETVKRVPNDRKIERLDKETQRFRDKYYQMQTDLVKHELDMHAPEDPYEGYDGAFEKMKLYAHKKELLPGLKGKSWQTDGYDVIPYQVWSMRKPSFTLFGVGFLPKEYLVILSQEEKVLGKPGVTLHFVRAFEKNQAIVDATRQPDYKLADTTVILGELYFVYYTEGKI